MLPSFRASIFALAASALPALPALAQQLPPIKPLGTIVARSTEEMGSVAIALPMPEGRVLVNDILKHRVLMFDSTLTNVTVVADSTSSTANAYGNRSGGLIAYRGDSALFVDPASMSMLVIDPAGKIARVMSAPRPTDVAFLVGGPNGFPAFDAKGRLVYRGQTRFAFAPAKSGSGPSVPDFPDSAAIVRFDLTTRTLDTAAFFRIPKIKMSVSQDANGRMMISSQFNPIPTVDDWAVLNDGTIAVVRGNDYHIDWIGADGTVTSSAKVPYDWQRLDDDGKMALLDSAKAAMEKARETAQARANANGPIAAGDRAANAATEMTIVTRVGAGSGAPPARGDAAGRGNGAPGQIQLPPINMVPISELADYRPAFSTASARGDRDGNLWVRTTSPVGDAGPVYYVINRDAQVVARLQVPEGRLVAGFGPNGEVYLSVRDAEGNVHLERARVK
jgi:hypothetical protein